MSTPPGESVQVERDGERDPAYRFLFDRNLAGVYRTTLDGRILECNYSFARMLGYGSCEEVLARHAADFYVRPTDREEFLGRLTANQGLLLNSELTLKCKDGSQIEILENVALVRDVAGNPAVIEGTAIDITQRKRAEHALRHSEQRYRSAARKLRRLTQHMQSVRETERRRIAHELHDELGQALTVLHMDLHWLQGRAWHDADATRARLQAMVSMVTGTLESVRRICADLRPTVLDDFGLVAAIEWQAREFEARSGLVCRFTPPAETPTLDDERALAVFRVLQEALTNIARHAQARTVRLGLRFVGHAIVLNVCDDGVGVQPEQLVAPGSLGLAGMRERARQWGGKVTVSRGETGGTCVVMTMPIGTGKDANS